MRNGTQLAGVALAAAGVAVGLRGVYDSGGPAMMVLGLAAAVAGTVLIFRGHYRAVREDKRSDREDRV
jgi:hypothetical protein